MNEKKLHITVATLQASMKHAQAILLAKGWRFQDVEEYVQDAAVRIWDRLEGSERECTNCLATVAERVRQDVRSYVDLPVTPSGEEALVADTDDFLEIAASRYAEALAAANRTERRVLEHIAMKKTMTHLERTTLYRFRRAFLQTH